MLSDQSMQPSVGIRHSMFGLSACSCTASPDQPITATALPLVRSLAVVVAGEAADLARFGGAA